MPTIKIVLIADLNIITREEAVATFKDEYDLVVSESSASIYFDSNIATTKYFPLKTNNNYSPPYGTMVFVIDDMVVGSLMPGFTEEQFLNSFRWYVNNTLIGRDGINPFTDGNGSFPLGTGGINIPNWLWAAKAVFCAYQSYYSTNNAAKLAYGAGTGFAAYRLIKKNYD